MGTGSYLSKEVQRHSKKHWCLFSSIYYKRLWVQRKKNKRKGNNNNLHCAVIASKRIYKRAKKVKLATDKSIAVFTECNIKKKICFIDNVHITNILREAASKLHIITYKKELAKFTSHSIRVGACVFSSCTTY